MARRARTGTGIVVAGTCLALAACGGARIAAQGNSSSPAASAGVSSPVQSSSPPGIPSALAGPEQPVGACPYVTQRQVEKALGRRVQHFKGCLWSFADGAGTIGIETSVYTSAALARECFTQQQQSVGQGFSSRPIPDLGQSAESVVLPKAGGVVAILLRGAKWIVVGIVWPPAVKHPEPAIILLRD